MFSNSSVLIDCAHNLSVFFVVFPKNDKKIENFMRDNNRTESIKAFRTDLFPNENKLIKKKGNMRITVSFCATQWQ